MEKLNCYISVKFRRLWDLSTHPLPKGRRGVGMLSEVLAEANPELPTPARVSTPSPQVRQKNSFTGLLASFPWHTWASDLTSSFFFLGVRSLAANFKAIGHWF